MPIREHNARLEAQRQATASEIDNLAASKHAALAERDDAINRITVIVQDGRREAYALRRVASNIAIHAEAEMSRQHESLPSVGSFTGKQAADIFVAAEETSKKALVCYLLFVRLLLFYFYIFHMCFLN